MEDYLRKNRFNYRKISDYVYEIPGVGKFLYIGSTTDAVIKDGKLVLTEYESIEQQTHSPDYFAFYLSDLPIMFYCPIKSIWDIRKLLYLGSGINELQLPEVGLHGNYELVTHTTYKDYVQKAKFLGIERLGVCETNLSGAINFYFECKKQNITPIIGLTKKIQGRRCKLYCKTPAAFNTLVKLSNCSITLQELKKIKNEEIIIVLSTDFIDVLDDFTSIGCYFQFDVTRISSNTRDLDKLAKLKQYYHKYKHTIPPILINDVYFCEQWEWEVRDLYCKIQGVKYEHSKDCYFKTIDQKLVDIYSLFKSDCDDFIEQLILNTNEAFKDIQLELDTSFKFPRYILSQEDKKVASTNEELFFHIISTSLENKGLSGKQEYIERVEKELSVILKGGFVDYFLILWDLIRYAERNNILVGVGRGSAGGSLIAYLMGITKIDPLPHGLLFERFLNSARIKTSPPDIDTDFQSDKREDIKRYLEERYGKERVASIGTFTKLQNRGVFKELCRLFNVPPQRANYFSSSISNDWSYGDILRYFSTTQYIKSFFVENRKVFKFFSFFIDLIKSRSMHAAGVIITPDKVDNMIPIREEGGHIVTEWEGVYLDSLGFLKEDILGILQLQKFKEILQLIKHNTGTEVDIFSLPLDDDNVYEGFRAGNNEDVFQFGGSGLRSYVIELAPGSVNDLIATIALYRPGPIESNAHIEYIHRKNGKKQVEYDHPLLEEVLKDTYGLFVYQEQIIRALQILANFTPEEADKVRKGLGKLDAELISSYREKFLQGCLNNNIRLEIAEDIWNKMVAFAKYGFNKSHAVSYAVTGYICQWLKTYHPLEFWTVSLQHSNEQQLNRRIIEINKTKNIKLAPPDINLSSYKFVPNVQEKEIIWSLVSIKGIQETTIKNIITLRDEKRFSSFEDFYQRVKQQKIRINIRQIESLILAGAFDKIEGIITPSQRISLLQQLQSLHKGYEVPDWVYDIIDDDNKWILKQKELCGLGYINTQIYEEELKCPLLPIENFLDINNKSRIFGGIIGVVTDVQEKDSRRGKFGIVSVNYFNENITAIMWSEIWEKIKKDVVSSKGEIIGITGELKFDEFRKENVLQTNLKTIIKTF